MKSKNESINLYQQIPVSFSNSLIVRIFSGATILGVFFDQYNSPVFGITMGEFLVIFAIFILIISFPKRVMTIHLNIFFQVFCIRLFLSFLSIILQRYYDVFLFTRWLRYFSHALMILFQIKFLDYKLLIQVYRILCRFIALYVIMQFFMFTYFNIYLPVNLLPISFRVADVQNTNLLLESANKYYFRAYGVFTEPGYVAKFVLPGLVLSMFGWDEHKRIDFFSFSIILVTLLLTASVQAIVVGFVSVVLSMYEILKNGKKKNGKAYTYLIVIIGIIVFLFAIYKFNDLISAPITRLQKISFNSTGSTGIRLFRGFAIFLQLPIIYKLIGIGLGNISYYVINQNITTYYDSPIINDTTLGYTSGISAILVESGIIGILLFMYWFFKERNRISRVQRIILYQFVILLFGGGSILDMFAVFFLAFLSQHDPIT